MYNSQNKQNGELLVEVERFYGQSLDQRPSYLQYKSFTDYRFIVLDEKYLIIQFS